MPDQKISELSAITTIDNSADVLPIVDTSATTTKKVTPTQLKTSLALNNVDNTSDANKPISSATQTALDAKQATLVSGTNIKTVNNTSLLGSGNITIAGGGGTWGSITGTLSNQTDLQTALDAKVDENAAITGATKTKITYDAKGLVTAGADATTADIADSTNKRYVTDAQLTVIGNTSGTNTGDNAVNSLYSGLATSKQDTLVSGTNIKTVNSTSLLGSGNISVAPASGIDATAIADGSVTSTEFQYINSLTSNAQTQIDSKQATLVSGTNIKTVNGTTILGSGDIAVQATLVSGTNIKTINSTSLLGSGDIVISASPSGVSGAIQFSNGSAFASDAANLFWDDTNNWVGVGTNAPSATAHFKGSGTTSGTTALLVQNSNAATALEVKNNLTVGMGGAYVSGSSGFAVTVASITASYPCFLMNQTAGATSKVGFNLDTAKLYFSEETNGSTLFGHRLMADTRNGGFVVKNDTAAGVTASLNASAVLQADSTTRGFLPPRMTTTQKNAIATPAAGLVVYDTTLAKLCVYTTTWETITSL